MPYITTWCIIFDIIGIESYAAENNSKRLVNGGPDIAISNPQVKLQYINGHMFYTQRTTVVANGLRDLSAP
jgi:hypothetical protein